MDTLRITVKLTCALQYMQWAIQQGRIQEFALGGRLLPPSPSRASPVISPIPSPPFPLQEGPN